GVLQGLERRQPAAGLLRLLAHVRQLGLAGALLVLQLHRGLLATLQLLGQPVQRQLLLLVAQDDVLARLRQRLQVERRALGLELFAAAVGVQRLAVEVIGPGPVHAARARGLVLPAPVLFPALLPVGPRLPGLAQRLLAHAVVLAQRPRALLGLGDRGLQLLEPGLVAADVGADLLQRVPGLLARLDQAFGELALVGDLLLDP